MQTQFSTIASCSTPFFANGLSFETNPNADPPDNTGGGGSTTTPASEEEEEDDPPAQG